MPKLHFYYSAMNAGKTTTLLQSAYNYNERGIDVLLFCPKVDDRYEIGVISSRIGLKAPALVFDENFDFFECVVKAITENNNIKCILVDEAQFLTKLQVEQLVKITVELSLPVLAYGLRSDFRGEPFVGSTYLLAWAEQLIELKTICHCGKKAIMNIRVDKHGNRVLEGEQIEIGGNDRYIAVCRKHFESEKIK